MWRGLTFDRIPLSKEEAGSATLGVEGVRRSRRVCLNLSKLALAGSQGVQGRGRGCGWDRVRFSQIAPTPATISLIQSLL